MDRLCSAQYSWGTKARERLRGEEQGFEVRALSHSHYCRSSFAALVRTFGPLRFQPANCGLEWTPGGRPTIFQPACSFWHNKGYQAPLSRGGYPSRNSENRYCSSCNSAMIAEIVRGRHVESCHLGHAVVVDSNGRVLFAAGNHERPTFPRSALKPLQALAGIMSGTDHQFRFTDAELAVICGSHRGEPRHRAAVRSILEKIGATEEHLHCGPPAVVDIAPRDDLIRAGQAPTAIYNNCSGKHAGMLALAKVLDASMEGYWNIDHPVQQKIQRICCEMCGVDGASRLEWAIDGCAVPTYLRTLHQLAQVCALVRSAAPPTSLCGCLWSRTSRDDY